MDDKDLELHKQEELDENTKSDDTNRLNNEKRDEGSVWAGIGLAILLYIIFSSLSSLFQTAVFLYLGILLHIIGIIYFFATGKKYLAIGLLIPIGIGILLVAACFGIIATM